MEILNETPYPFLAFDASPEPARQAVTLIVKGTFKLVAEGPAEPLPHDDQAQLVGDDVHMDDIGRSLRYGTDLVPFKLRGEVTVAALCRPPTPQTRNCDVTIALGPIQKTLRVSGDRAFPDPVKTEPFETLPIRWERTFGGLSFTQNPLGRGMEPWPTPSGPVHYLPNVEYPDERMNKPGDRVRPASLAPILPHWSPRLEQQGTRDQRWAAFRAPLPPVDFDPQAHQAAPADQQLRDGEFFRGDEPLTLTNLHPKISVFRGGLPGRRLRVFVERRVPYGEPAPFEEVAMKLDTVHVDTEAETVTLVWRQPIGIAGPVAVAVAAVYITEESLAQPGALADVHRARFDQLRGPKKPRADVELDKHVAEQHAQATKVLRDGNIDPKFVADFERTKDPAQMFEKLMKLLDEKVADAEKLAAQMKGPR
jgi:hypothetical protein